MIADKIAEVRNELALLEAIHEDFIVKGYPIMNMRTDAVYEMFCRWHPDIVVSKRRFTQMIVRETGLKPKQAFVDGTRGYFYEY